MTYEATRSFEGTTVRQTHIFTMGRHEYEGRQKVELAGDAVMHALKTGVDLPYKHRTCDLQGVRSTRLTLMRPRNRYNSHIGLRHGRNWGMVP